jgi:ABC-type transport system involved in multi-copper enzyme maturation permease subunit
VKGRESQGRLESAAAGVPVALATPGLPEGRSPASAQLSAVRAWLYLLRLCFLRQARTHQLVWIALTLLALMTAVVGLNTLADRWTMNHWRYPRRVGLTYESWIDVVRAVPQSPAATAYENGFLAASQAILANSGFYIFGTWVIFGVFLSFLLPIWSLSFATDALGGEREARTLVWLLNLPLPRPLVYLAKFAAILPFSLGLNLGGFLLLCLVAGRAGQPALVLFWPAIIWGTLTFCALFHLMGALFRRSAVVAIVYSFFLETILGNMPGYMKRVSIGFYTRCMMFEEAQSYGIQPEKPSIYLPVDGLTAQLVLAGSTIVFLGIGMVVFTRTEYHDLT